MILTLEFINGDTFQKFVNEVKIMMPIYPLTKPHIDFIDWHNYIIKLATDGEYYSVFTAMLKKYIIERKVKISINLKYYPLAIYNKDMIPDADWLITI